MRKGELKKKEILKTAESRFCRFGYESTSIQEILDDLHTSKGSFYHHFVSKESLLEEICRIRAESHYDTVLKWASDEPDPLKRINIFFSGMSPFSGEKLSFLMMILPVFLLTEGMRIRNCYEEALTDLYGASVASAIQEASEKRILACRNPEFSAHIALTIINHFWLAICDLILRNEQAGIKTDPSDLLRIAEEYRTVLERILSAPFGSIELIQLTDLQSIIDQIHLHWKTE